MNPVEPLKYDPNEPEIDVNGNFFCRLCLSTMNSKSMWSSHVAGKRHIKNAQKYPTGLPRAHEDEDSYERPPKRERFDDYDLHDEYPPNVYDDDRFVDNYHPKVPPRDYVPAIKPNLVFDYGHTKKLDETILPPPVPAIPRPATVPSVTAIAPSAPDVSADTLISVLDQILGKGDIAKPKPPVKDDFFEKINQREIAKEIAKELSKKCIFVSKDAKSDDDDHKSHSSRKSFSRSDRHDREKPDIFDILHENNDKRLFSIEDEKESKRKSSSSKSSSSSSKTSSSSYKKSSSSSKPSSSSSRPSSSSSSYKPSSSSLSKSSSSKSKSKLKSELDDLDPDDLTADDLDALLSAQLKQKKSDSSDEVCTKKHCPMNNVNLDDPKILAEKLQSLPTMEFLEIIHNKIVSLDLTSSGELKLLLKVIADAQTAACKKLPPELQSLVRAKLAGNDANKDAAVSQNQPVASSVLSNTVSQISATPVPSPSQVTGSVKSILKSSSPQIPPAQFVQLASPSISNAPVSHNQTSATSVSSVVFPQSQVQVPFSYPSSIMMGASPAITSILSAAMNRMPATTMAPNPTAVMTSMPATVMTSMPAATMTSMSSAAMTSMQPAVMTSMPSAAIPAPTSVASLNNQAMYQSLQSNSVNNYYNAILSMYQNRQVAPSNAPNMNVNQQLSAPRYFPPPPPPPLPSKLTLSQEISNAIAKLKGQTQMSSGQSNQQSSSSFDNSQSKRNAEVLDTLKKLEALENDYKRKRLNSLRKDENRKESF